MHLAPFPRFHYFTVVITNLTILFKLPEYAVRCLLLRLLFLALVVRGSRMKSSDPDGAHHSIRINSQASSIMLMGSKDSVEVWQIFFMILLHFPSRHLRPPTARRMRKKIVILKSKFNVDDDDPFSSPGISLFFRGNSCILVIVWAVIKDSCRWMILQKKKITIRRGAICCSVKQRQQLKSAHANKVKSSPMSDFGGWCDDPTLMGNCFSVKLLYDASSRTVVNVKTKKFSNKLQINFLPQSTGA